MAGRASSIDVFLRLHGQRKFSKELAASGAELEAMGVKGARSIARFAASGARLKQFGRSWTRNVSMPIAALGAVAGGMAMTFDRQMSLISTQAGGSASEVKRLTGSVEDLAKHSQFAPTELAKGLFFIESAGVRGAKAMKLLNANVRLATAGNSDLEHTVFGTVGAMNALGKEGKNFNRIASIMNATVGHGHMRMEELVGALGTGITGTAKSFGVSFGGMNSAIAFFTRMGEPAQQVATRLRQTITHLATSATTKGAEALESIGISTDKMGESIRKTGKLGPVIKELTEHLQGISKNRANQVITEAFGGGRFGTQIREATQRVGLFIRTEKEIGKSGTVEKLNKAFSEAKQQPLVKLKEAWSSIQVTLIKLGNDLLPIVVPALEKMATFVGKISEAFLALPGPVKAATVSLLILTGPVASGLGYFATGVGKSLILVQKLGMAMKDLQIVSTALMAGQGLSSFSIGLEGSGMAAAATYMKGFTFALAPLAAAAGIANIAYSASKHEWKQTGFKAGGALVGGIAGAFAGGPVGAMIGVGIGSMVGGMLAKVNWSKVIGLIPKLKLPALFSGFVGWQIALPLTFGKRIASFFAGLSGKVFQSISKLPGLVWGMLDKFPRMLGEFVGFFLTLPIRISLILTKLAVHSIKTLWGFAKHLPRIGWSAIKWFANGMIHAVPKVLSFVFSLPGRIISLLSSLPGKLFGSGEHGVSAMGKGAKAGGVSILHWFRKLPGALLDLLSGLGSKLFDLGGHIASEFAKGFYSSLPGPVKDVLGEIGLGSEEKTGSFGVSPKLNKHLGQKHPERHGHRTPHRQHHGAGLSLPNPHRARLEGGNGALANALHVIVEANSNLFLDGKEIAQNTTRHSATAAARA
jgi:TP901 family phage tail tape measure protein